MVKPTKEQLLEAIEEYKEAHGSMMFEWGDMYGAQKPPKNAIELEEAVKVCFKTLTNLVDMLFELEGV